MGNLLALAQKIERGGKPLNQMTPAEVIATNADGMNIPDCLRIPQEERRAAWAANPPPTMRPTTMKTPASGTKEADVKALRVARANGVPARTVITKEAAAGLAQAVPGVSTGFDRMKKNLGPKAAEEVRQQVLADQKSVTTPQPADPAEPKESSVIHKTTTKTKPAPTAKKADAKKTERRQAKPAKAARSAARSGTHAAKKTEGGVRPGTKLATIVSLLQRPQGCTTKDVLKATDWPAVSMPQQAKLAGLKLIKEKKDGVTVYRAG